MKRAPELKPLDHYLERPCDIIPHMQYSSWAMQNKGLYSAPSGKAADDVYAISRHFDTAPQKRYWNSLCMDAVSMVPMYTALATMGLPDSLHLFNQERFNFLNF